ncbi:MAG: T9SS type A sorting domain-containing protein [Saprospiraceae bacterium]
MKTIRHILLIGLLFISIAIHTKAQDCDAPSSRSELSVNAVRAGLVQGGSLWWNGNDARFAVPKNSNPQFDVHSFFAGGIWIGGFDPGGNVKIAASTYGYSQGNSDYYAGPVNTNGSTDGFTCALWDRFFHCTQADIDLHKINLQKAAAGNLNYTKDLIPDKIKSWPANGNPYFEEMNHFALPTDNSSFTEFFDANENGIYEPLQGDYPVVYTGCNVPVIADEMVYWVFNDVGNIHTESRGDVIGLEIHATAFAFKGSGAIDSSQFYKYRMVNKSGEKFQSARFGLWVDPDLGCYTDDYIGCDTSRALMYSYNEDELDGPTCPGGVNSFGEEIPVVGVDILGVQHSSQGTYVRPMDYFTYYDNSSVGNPVPGTLDPQTPAEHFRLMGGGGRYLINHRGDSIQFAFPDPPNCDDLNDCYNMCNYDPGPRDRRTVQSTGAFDMEIGDEVSVYFATVFAGNMKYPCPNLDRFFSADDQIQGAYDNCFDGLSSDSKPDLISRNFNIYPNPISNGQILNIEGMNQADEIIITDLQGRLVFKALSKQSEKIQVDLKDKEFQPGIYFLQIRRNQNLLETRKLVFID